jgi:hypothetical protein
MSARLVQVAAVQGVGLVRVTWSAEFREFTVRAVAADGRRVAEYFTDDRMDALDTAARILQDLATRAGAA